MRQRQQRHSDDLARGKGLNGSKGRPQIGKSPPEAAASKRGSETRRPSRVPELIPAAGVPPSGGVRGGALEEVLNLLPETATETRRSLIARLFGKRLSEGASDGDCVRRVDCTARRTAQGLLRSTKPELEQAKILDGDDPTPPHHEP